MRNASCGERGGLAARPSRVIDLVALAASPTFALMALASGFLEHGSPAAICSSAHTSPLTGMTTMYVLMSLFHATAWLRMAGWR